MMPATVIVTVPTKILLQLNISPNMRKKHGVNPATLAVAWIKANPVVTEKKYRVQYELHPMLLN
jgi:hypothetical protein